MRIDFTIKSDATPDQLIGMPSEHPMLRWHEGKPIVLADRWQCCGNIDTLSTRAHTLPKEFRSIAGVLDPYLVTDDADTPIHDSEDRINWSIICGDGGKPLRSFTEGGKHRLATKPGETLWYIGANFSKTRTTPQNPAQWSYFARPSVPGYYEGSWFVETGALVSGKIRKPINGGWLSDHERESFPWIELLFKRCKQELIASGCLPSWFEA